MTEPPAGWWPASDGRRYPPLPPAPMLAAPAAVPSPRRRHRRRWIVGGAVLLVVIVVAGVLAAHRSGGPLRTRLGHSLTLSGQPHEKAEVTLVRILDPATQTAQFAPASLGYRYVGVVIVVHNTGTVDVPDAEIDGTVDDGVLQAPVGLQKCPTRTGTIRPGQTHIECNTFALAPGVAVRDYILHLNWDGARSGRWTVH